MVHFPGASSARPVDEPQLYLGRDDAPRQGKAVNAHYFFTVKADVSPKNTLCLGKTGLIQIYKNVRQAADRKMRRFNNSSVLNGLGVG